MRLGRTALQRKRHGTPERAATVPRVQCAYVLKRFPRLSQTFVLEEVLELERQGLDLAVLAARGPGGPVPARATRVTAPVEYLPADVPEDVDAAADWFAERIRSLGVGHVHAHFAGWASQVAAIAATHVGVGFSFTAHATDIYRDSVDESALAARIEAASFVVTVSEANRAHLGGLLERHGRHGRLVRIYNGVDAGRLRPRPAPPEPATVVAVGRLVEKKGFDVLVDALSLLRDDGVEAQATLVGDGPLRQSLEARVAAAGLGDRVHLVGARSHEEVVDLLGRSVVLAMPCVVAGDGDRDGLPTVILESMALGTPVVSTRVSGVPEMVDDGRSGLLVEQRDPVALAAALKDVLTDAALRQRLATAARDVVTERFDLATNVATLRDALSGSALVAREAR